jgi:hypothetical protein
MRVAFDKFKIMIFMILIFYSLGVLFWLLFNSIFYLINFVIIGTSVALGLGLWPVFPKAKKHIARKISQLLVGGFKDRLRLIEKWPGSI